MEDRIDSKERLNDFDAYCTRLEDIKHFKGTRATTIYDNSVFWKRTLNAYGKDYHVFCKKKEETDHVKRKDRVKSAPMILSNKEWLKSHSDTPDSLLHLRAQSACSFFNQDNRASRLRQEYLKNLRKMNVHSVLTRFDDYRREVRPHRPSNSARYPRLIENPKSAVDPEWDRSEYDVYVFHSKVDRAWVENWIQSVLESKRYNVKINANKQDIIRFIHDEDSQSRLIFILTPEFVSKTLKRLPIDRLQQDTQRSLSILALKLRSCDVPAMLHFTNFMDLSFCNMTDLTLQCHLLPKLVSTLQLPSSVCS